MEALSRLYSSGAIYVVAESYVGAGDSVSYVFGS